MNARTGAGRLVPTRQTMHDGRMKALLLAVGWSFAIAFRLPAQDEPRQEVWETPPARRGQEPASWQAWLPTAFQKDRAAPLVVWFGEPHAEAFTNLTQRGFVVVTTSSTQWKTLLSGLPRHCHSEHGAFHAVVRGDADPVVPVLLEHRSYFQSITCFGDEHPNDQPALRRLPARRVHSVASDSGAALVDQLLEVHMQRMLSGAAGEVSAVLDDFHHAAAIGDADRYFAILPLDAVYLGTDGSERWTGTQFRQYASSYFRRGSAWTYLCLQRSVNVDLDGEIACFDETFDHPSYGECRGSGVMRKRNGAWVLRQYHLTVPVPNDVTRQVVARIRAFQDKAPHPQRIVLVPQIEPAAGDLELSPEGQQQAERLARLLEDLPFAAVYASDAPGAQKTVAPLCAARGTTPDAWSETDVRRAMAKHNGPILVCDRNDAVAALLRTLRVPSPIRLKNDRLLLVTIWPEGQDLLTLRY